MRYLMFLFVLCVGCSGSSREITHLAIANLPFDKDRCTTELRGRKLIMDGKTFWEFGEKDPLKVDVIQIVSNRDDMHNYCTVTCNVDTSNDGKHWLIGDIRQYWRNDTTRGWWLESIAKGWCLNVKEKFEPAPPAPKVSAVDALIWPVPVFHTPFAFTRIDSPEVIAAAQPYFWPAVKPRRNLFIRRDR